MNNYAFPFETPLSRGTFDFCDGPGGRFAAWVASAGIRYGLWTPGNILDDSFGQTNRLFTGGERPTKLSICFDVYHREVIAIQRDAANIRVRYFEQSDIAPIPVTADMDTITVDDTSITADTSGGGSLVLLESNFVGLSPILFFNGVSSIDPNHKDVIVFYLKDDQDTIYCRFLADAFGVESIINGGLPVNLVALLKADLITSGGSNYLGIWALTDDGRQVFIRSERYAPEVEDNMSADQTTGAGTYVNPPSTPTIHDDLTADIALHGSEYADTVLTNAGPSDALTVDATIASGLYIATVLPTTPSADALTLAATIASGTYS